MLENLRNQVRKEPLAVISLAIGVIGSVLNSAWFWGFFEGTLEATVAVFEDPLGRCVDREIAIENTKNTYISNIRILVKASYLVSRGDVELTFATLSDAMIGYGERTTLERKHESSADYHWNGKSLVLSVPRLSPGERLHFTFSESGPGLQLLYDLARKPTPQVMNVPAIAQISHDGGIAKLRYVFEGECSSRNRS